MTDPGAISVLIVDDHPVVRRGVRSLLGTHSEFGTIWEAESREEAISLFQHEQPSITLLDIRLGGESGLDVLDDIRTADGDACVVMLSSFDDDEYIERALRLGATGYVLKHDSHESLVDALFRCLGGRRAFSADVVDRVVGGLEPPEETFSDAERSILALLADGQANAEIAEALYMSEATLKRRLKGIFDQLGASTRAQAAAEAVRRGIV